MEFWSFMNPHCKSRYRLSSSSVRATAVHHTLIFCWSSCQGKHEAYNLQPGASELFHHLVKHVPDYYISASQYTLKKKQLIRIRIDIFFGFAHPDYSKLMYQSAGVGASFMSYGHDHRQVILIDWDTRIWKSAPWVAGKSPYTGEISS